MPLDMNVPDWIADYVADAVKFLGITEWSVNLSLAMAPGDDSGCLAITKQYPDTNSACIIFRADLEDNEFWRTVALHELLHVAHARVDHLVEDAIIEELPDGYHGIASRAYHQVVESYTHQMALALAKVDF